MAVLYTCLSYSLYQVPSQQLHSLAAQFGILIISCRIYCETYLILSLLQQIPTASSHAQTLIQATFRKYSLRSLPVYWGLLTFILYSVALKN